MGVRREKLGLSWAWWPVFAAALLLMTEVEASAWLRLTHHRVASAAQPREGLGRTLYHTAAGARRRLLPVATSSLLAAVLAGCTTSPVPTESSPGPLHSKLVLSAIPQHLELPRVAPVSEFVQRQVAARKLPISFESGRPLLKRSLTLFELKDVLQLGRSMQSLDPSGVAAIHALLPEHRVVTGKTNEDILRQIRDVPGNGPTILVVKFANSGTDWEALKQRHASLETVLRAQGFLPIDRDAIVYSSESFTPSAMYYRPEDAQP